MTRMTSTWTTQYFFHECYTSSCSSPWSGPYGESSIYTTNQLLKSVKQLFQVTETLLEDQTEISGLTTFDYEQPTWRSSISVLCLGGISDQPVEVWKNKIRRYLETRFLKDLNRMDGEPMGFEWKNFPGFTTWGILEDIQKMMTELQSEPEQFKGRIIFMSIYNDFISWD